MKKSHKTKTTYLKKMIVEPVEPEAPAIDVPPDEEGLAGDQFAVAGRQEEATSTGHRVEPIEEDDEHNAEKLIEEGLHGYLRAVPKKPHSPR